jgi:hypothetical protein
MLGRGRHQRSRSKHRLEKRQEDRQRRTIAMVDLRTGLTHLLTPNAADAGLVALCGRPVRFAVRWHDGQGECRCIDLVLLGALQLYLRAVFAWSRAPRATRACKQANAAAAIETTAPPRGRNGAPSGRVNGPQDGDHGMDQG